MVGSRAHVAFLVAVLHGLCALGSVGGAILCLEADGCFEIELGSDACCAAAPVRPAPGRGPLQAPAPSSHGGCQGCTDVPLDTSLASVAGQRTSVAVDLLPAQPALHMPVAGLAPERTQACARRLARAVLPELGPLVAQRTIVLLI